MGYPWELYEMRPEKPCGSYLCELSDTCSGGTCDVLTSHHHFLRTLLGRPRVVRGRAAALERTRTTI